MTEEEIILSCRNTAYLMDVAVNRLPAPEKQMAAIVSFLDFVRERQDVTVVIRITDEAYEDEVPQVVRIAASYDGLYMELVYDMSDWDWKHPLLLANAHLTEEEAISVLLSIFHDCTDDNPIVFNSFGNISECVYSEEE